MKKTRLGMMSLITETILLTALTSILGVARAVWIAEFSKMSAMKKGRERRVE